MSYIPPHLRDKKPKSPISERAPPQNQANRPASSISTCTCTTQQYSTDLTKPVYRHPYLHIRSSSDAIYRLIVLPHHQHQHVTFTRFEGDTYSHLEPFNLYTLTADLHHPAQPQNSTEVIEQIPQNPANVIIKALKQDLEKVLDKFGRLFAQGESRDTMAPVILLRFGRIIFDDRRSFSDWGSSHTPQNLERIGQRILSKTFDVCLSREEFVFLRKLAHKDALHIQFEEKFIIQFEDKMRPGSYLLCTCSILSKHDEQSINPGKTDDLSEIMGSAKHVLELKKVMAIPIRHMIGDVACIGKNGDIRLALFVTEEYPLNEMELCDLKSSFDKASIDDTTLDFSLELNHSTSGRFKAMGGSHVIMKVVTSGGLKWYFSASTASYQVYVEPIICHEFCEGQKEWNTEKVISSIEELLQRVICII